MIVIDKMILHVLDPSSNIAVYSDTCMDGDEDGSLGMIEAKITKAFTSSQRKMGSFKEGSPIQHMLEEYRASLINFEEMSKQMAKFIFEAKMKYGQFVPSDLLICEVLFEDRRYIIGLDNSYLENLTHHTSQDGELIHNDIITHKTILSQSLVKKDSAFMIECSDYSVSSVEAKVEIEAEKRYFYGDVVLTCENTPSYKDAVKSITKACTQAVKEYELNEVEILPKMKQIIKENVEAQSDIQIEEVAQVLFEDRPQAKAKFKEEVQNQGIKKPVSVENVKSTKAEKVQKIRTDKGIEVIIPVDYMNSTDYIEFTNLPDGTISIQLKNINRIVSK